MVGQRKDAQKMVTKSYVHTEWVYVLTHSVLKVGNFEPSVLSETENQLNNNNKNNLQLDVVSNMLTNHRN